MAVKHLFTRGYGNGTFNGTIALVVLRGYIAGEPPVGIIPCPPVSASVGLAACPPVRAN